MNVGIASLTFQTGSVGWTLLLTCELKLSIHLMAAVVRRERAMQSGKRQKKCTIRIMLPGKPCYYRGIHSPSFLTYLPVSKRIMRP